VGRKTTAPGGIEGFVGGEIHRKPGCRKGDPAFLFGWSSNTLLFSNLKEEQ